MRVPCETVKFMLHAIKLVLLTNANSCEKNRLIKFVKFLAAVELSNPISFADSVKAILTSMGFNPNWDFLFLLNEKIYFETSTHFKWFSLTGLTD